MTQPISAPPPVDEALREDYEVDRQEEAAAEFLQEERQVARASVPPARMVMLFSNRKNYSHYYQVPAEVGMRNVPHMVGEMMREGCDMEDIQISFERRQWRA